MARLAPLERPRRVFGNDRGAVTVTDDVDAPLPDNRLAAFER